jgi:hypothetical protein
MSEPEFSPEVEAWMDAEPELRELFLNKVLPTMGDWKEALYDE